MTARAYRAKSRTRVDQRGRSTNEFADAKMREGSRAPKGASWIWMTRELLESDALRGLSLSAVRALDRLKIEHLKHGGKENGLLMVTYDDFEAWGVRAASIRSALDELVQSGLVKVTWRDDRKGTRKRPNMYALTWLQWWKPAWDEDGEPAHERQPGRENWPSSAVLKKQNATPQNGGDNASETEVMARSITPQNGGDRASIITSEMRGAIYNLGGDGPSEALLSSDDNLGEAAA